MVIKTDLTDLQDFEAWSGAEDTKARICNAGLGERFITELELVYPDGMEDGELNDMLWFDAEWCLNLVGLNMDEDDDAEEDDDDAEDDDND